ncbi:hypothetical protein EHI8A_209890 [Entamoeba histolytica HM-1:IMSS-B]|uniref:Uncharacterized protein n=6 Tax=Entamoeba histolytica TaxID=5759 RepID=C4LZT1_ENTH1|nr:hypothetical protein EHI_194050 [Entamoeba histolytica HM-1:IMSS]EMD42653.1 Hypothetical protein EHI5A_204290 [Entamoeba histolytica KU27]EMH78315.1 hypothetical protein EHI8A_209890 [Entamoeba histolytica HM-1:IMSS-B]EMS15385.1 hypothetical protein KM1_270110 [Entamoeba histolytica HM-3:IMSS]ENY60742.1 hypothetical protein EHI7A_190020 [Entamoeba histolytica HM-1:IMSS-A]BAN39308.1 hypothetical protein [Entamoeba histolytica]|eukprot:XP_654724.1 hypothetical protein EHI_194050 [Entamoeba histolytica HM-1:IMSS]
MDVMCSKEVKQHKKKSGEDQTISDDVRHKQKHEENVFGQWGFLIYYILLKGGSVTIKPFVKKTDIDKRNQIDFCSVEVNGKILSAEEIQKQVIPMIDKSINHKYFRRTLRKYIHDNIMNEVVEWCKEEAKKEKIYILTKSSKKAKNENKPPNTIINSVNINGKNYNRRFITTNCGNWLKEVLKCLIPNPPPKTHTIIISQKTVPPNIIMNGMGLENLITKTPTITQINGYAGYYDACGELRLWNCQLYLPFPIEDKLNPIDPKSSDSQTNL